MSNLLLQYISFKDEDVAKHVYVDFRIRSDILDPKVLSIELGIQPSLAWAKGERYRGKEWNPETRQVVTSWRERPWGMWHLDSKAAVQTKKVEQHLLYLLDILEPKQDRLQLYLQRAQEYFVSFYIRWEPYEGHGSYEIASSVLTRAARLCHLMEFSFIHDD